MTRKNGIFLSGYYSHRRKHKTSDKFLSRLILVTSVISVCLISVSVFLIASLPKEAFRTVMSRNETALKKEEGFVYPTPLSEVRAKADRLREIRLEDHLAHCYTPIEAEFDGAYVYDYDKKCYLTFDDGPSMVTPMILDVLDQYKVKATFFVTGDRAEANPNFMKQIADGGHSIGNHSYSHVYDVVYASPDSFKEEVTKCKDAIDTALGREYENLIFRFPGGYDSLTNEDSKTAYRKVLGDMGYSFIDWNSLTGDSNTTDPTEEYLMDTLKTSIKFSKTGDIVVLMHDSPSKEITAKALPKIIEYLYDEGYQFEALVNTKK